MNCHSTQLNFMMSTWHSMWLDNNRICNVLQDLIFVPDVLISVILCTANLSSNFILVCMWHFANMKINVYGALCSFSICFLPSFCYVRVSFHRLLTEYRTNLERVVLQPLQFIRMTLLYMHFFCFGYYEQFLLQAYVGLGASYFVLVICFKHIFLSTWVLCLGCQLLGYSVFLYHTFCLFSMPFILIPCH